MILSDENETNLQMLNMPWLPASIKLPVVTVGKGVMGRLPDTTKRSLCVDSHTQTSLKVLT